MIRILSLPILCHLQYCSIYQWIKKKKKKKTALKCSNGACTYVKNTSGVRYRNKWDITPSPGSFEMHAVWVNFPRIASLRCVQVASLHLFLRHPFFQESFSEQTEEKFCSACLLIMQHPALRHGLAFFSRGGKKKKNPQMCSVEPFKHI